VTDSQLVPVVDVAHGLSSDAATDSAGSSEAIVVRLGTGRFAVDLASVAEVGKAPAITRVPGLPVWLSGVANWRGRILPVLDLRPLLGAEAAALDSHGRLLVLTGGGIAVGMLVDAVDGTTSLTNVAPFPSASAANSSHLMSGQVARDDGPLAVLDVAGVMRLREGLPRGRRSA
jgi:purine-binding chemotaxis protein CheW